MSAPMPPPPPPPPPQHQEEGIHDVVVLRIRDHLRQTGQHGDDLDSPSFADRLARHLRRLPCGYFIGYLDLDAGSLHEFLRHWRILDDCADPDKRPIFHARFMTAVHMHVHRSAPYYVGGDKDDDDHQELDTVTMFLHEIVFSGVDRPRILARLTALVSEVGLNVREAHVFTTVDGFLLAIFLVDGWETEVINV
nr:unnamed protein product [Digitaria exilis]